jgi:hypothetical protein
MKGRGQMSGLGGWILSVVGVLALLGIGPVWAQENVEAGKTPAQLYASDCAICHKSPNGLTKAGGLLGLQSFLREHYTASRETAAAIAQYLRTVDKGPPPPSERKRAATPTRSTKDEKPKSGEKTGEKTGERRGKADSGKAGSAKPNDKKKPVDAKPAEPKPAESKPAESKPAQGAAPKSSEKPPEKPPEAKPAATESAPGKPPDSKPPESKPADGTPPPPDKPAKSD